VGEGLAGWVSPFVPLLSAAALFVSCASAGAPGTAPRAAPGPAAEAPGPATPEDICTTPIRPPGLIDIVHRFGRWTLGTRSLGKGADPRSAFAAVSASGLGNLRNTNVYVVTHGWAPGWNAAVVANGSTLRWWSTRAGVDPNTFGPCDPTRRTCLWPSDFAWTGSSYDGLVISEKGLLPAIVANDPDALVLAYSWLDDSATGGSSLQVWTCAFESGRYTNLNGLRLASGLVTILGKDFWDSTRGNSLHLIGHSHGSKVVTTAARALQKNSLQVDQLTILDSPESVLIRDDSAANLNWIYLREMNISTNPKEDPAATPIFVDNYVSEFGLPYTDFEKLEDVVDVSLNPGTLTDDAAFDHTYAATWYSGAAAEGRTVQAFVGLDWSPVLAQAKTAALEHLYNQTWPEVTRAGQVQLSPARPSPTTTIDLVKVELSDAQASGTAKWDGNSQVLSFAPGGSGELAIEFECDSSIFELYQGVAFDVELKVTAMTTSQLVVDLGATRYLVINGEYDLNDTYLVSFNAGENHSFDLTFRSQASGASSSVPWIVINNFRCIELSEL
jgi:hypothetical protein